MFIYWFHYYIVCCCWGANTGGTRVQLPLVLEVLRGARTKVVFEVTKHKVRNSTK